MKFSNEYKRRYFVTLCCGVLTVDSRARFRASLYYQAQRNKNNFFYIHLKIGFKHNNSNDCFFFLKIRLERKIMKGKLYGIGVGPGDPELLTLKAKRLIEECDIVAVPVKKEEIGRAHV